MRVLVIGGTSFIGPPLVRRLVEQGHRVAVFHRGRSQAELPPSVDHILGDRHDLGGHADELRRLAPDVVVDMIAFTEQDALGLVATYRGLARRLVVISSADVYRAYGRFLGSEPGLIEPTPLSEDAPLRLSLFPYRHQAQGLGDFRYTYDKIPVERVVMGERGLPGTVLRLPMVHGPGDPYRRLSAYLKRMDDGRPAIVLNEGLTGWKCPRGYVEDVSAAIALAVVDDRAAGRVYNVAESVAYPEIEWVRRIGAVAGWPGKILTVPRSRIPLPYHVEQDLDTDSGRIRRELGFTEVVAPQTALERTVAWERANPGGPSQGIGLLDYNAENALLAEIEPGG
ncbi:MAG TPA: NAD-dependent epimerase/dehydratase family protein, partial [Isosphaeraceae bacterium]|nr:NAD-dependent epimerase/dehydratase family protein [Isosphaeraceae bacterium]